MRALLSAFAQHRIAPNALMFVVIFIGLIALDRLNTQFLPDFDLKVATVNTEWAGASAEDVQEGVTIPLEQAILQLTEVDRLTTTTIEGGSFMTITFKESITDVESAVSEVEKALATVNLPDGADEPTVNQVVFYEPVAEVLLYGDLTLDELQYWGESAEQSLQAAGIAKVDLTGLPERELNLRMTVADYLSGNASLTELGQQLAGQNLNVPAGITGEGQIQSQLRVRNQVTDEVTLGRQALALGGSVIAVDQRVDVSEDRNADETQVLAQQGS